VTGGFGLGGILGFLLNISNYCTSYRTYISKENKTKKIVSHTERDSVFSISAVPSGDKNVGMCARELSNPPQYMREVSYVELFEYSKLPFKIGVL
jgi:hypothetical protein